MADIKTNLISVIGGASADREEMAWAAKLGNLLADNGFTVICGGGTGIMEAVCRGVAEKDGHSIGILPGSDPNDANRWVKTVIVTGMGTSRNRIIALSGSVVAAVGGRYGTLSEIAYALQAGKPVCAVGRWAGIEGVVPVNSPEEALNFINENTWGDFMLSLAELESHIRNIPDFPVEGVIFKDITTLLTHPGALGDTVKHLEEACKGFEYDAVAAIESRGFIFGSVVAAKNDLPLVLIRKPGKLPGDTLSEEYTLEYGTNIVEMHKNSLQAGSRVLIIDDLIATGGSAMAAVSLLQQDGCSVVGAAFVVDLTFLGGGNKLNQNGIPYVKLIEVDSE